MSQSMQNNIGAVLQGLVLMAIVGVFNGIQDLEGSFNKLEQTVILNDYRLEQVEEVIKKPGH